MAGIERILINSDWEDERLQMSRDLSPAANEIYKSIFKRLDKPLAEGESTVLCTKDEAQARYDYKEGIDCILHFLDGTRGTLQEKFLEYSQSTVTIEEHKVNGLPGAWYYCTAQYYFVGYATDYWKSKSLTFRDYMLLNFANLKLAKVDWKFRYPTGYPSFRYIPFDEVPNSAVIARRNNG